MERPAAQRVRGPRPRPATRVVKQERQAQRPATRMVKQERSVRLRTRDRLAPESVQLQAGDRSAPASVPLQTGDRSAPGSVRLRTRDQSAPASVRFRTRDRSAPESVRLQTGDRSAPWALVPVRPNSHIDTVVGRAVWRKFRGRWPRRGLHQRQVLIGRYRVHQRTVLVRMRLRWIFNGVRLPRFFRRRLGWLDGFCCHAEPTPTERIGSKLIASSASSPKFATPLIRACGWRVWKRRCGRRPQPCTRTVLCICKTVRPTLSLACAAQNLSVLVR